MYIMAEFMHSLLAMVCFVLVFLWFHYRNKNTELTDWPLIRMLPSLYANLPRIHDYMVEVLTRTGGTYKFKGPWFANMDMVVTCDPDDVHYILTENFGNFHKGSEYNEIFDPLGDGIFNADKDLWKMQRRMMQLMMKKETVLHFLRGSTQSIVSSFLMPLLSHASMERAEIDLQQVLQNFSFHNVCSLVLGIDQGSLSDNTSTTKYRKAFDKMLEAVMCRFVSPSFSWKLQRWLRIGLEKQLDEAVKTMDPFLYESISSQREQLKRATMQGEQAPITMLTPFIREENVKDPNGDTVLSSKFLRDVALTLLFAGRDAISAALTWFFFLVAEHPLVENKLLLEMEANLDASDLIDKDQSGLFPTHKLDRLTYLHAALCETMRLYPPISINKRTAIASDTLPSGRAISSKAGVVLPYYAMGRMEKIWGPDCREFKPERWISEQGKIISVPSNKFIVFNAGPRTCLGKDMSFSEMKMVAASVMLNFQVQVMESHLVMPESSFVLSMKHGLKVMIIKRS